MRKQVWLHGLEHYSTAQVTVSSQPPHTPWWPILTIQIFHKSLPNIKIATQSILLKIYQGYHSPFYISQSQKNLNL